MMWSALAEAAHWRGREAASLAMLLLSASCVPLKAAPAPSGEALAARLAAPKAVAAAARIQPPPMLLQQVSPGDAVALNAAIPIADGLNGRAASVVFRAANPFDLQRSLQCLAEAVYYEARSESEDGQRAVAQVVLNRVRHPAYPASVCGVVYQGPLRAGGGCQFTFTCDGALGRPPAGPDWARARRIAAEALSGGVYAPVGHATHYHTHQVLPVWAYRLAKVAVIGSHNFYRMTGAGGSAAAFRQPYAGREPSPAAVIAARLPVNLGRAAFAVPPAWTGAAQRLPIALAPASTHSEEVSAPAAPVNELLPASTVREE